MAGFTNKGKRHLLGQVFNNETEPTNYYVFLATNAVAPTADSNTKSEFTELPNANGYTTGGIILAKNTTDFPTLTEDDGTDRGYIRIKNLVWTAAGGNLPSSGAGARWAILTDDNATQGSREVYAYFDLVSDRTISDTQQLTLTNCELRLNES